MNDLVTASHWVVGRVDRHSAAQRRDHINVNEVRARNESLMSMAQQYRKKPPVGRGRGGGRHGPSTAAAANHDDDDGGEGSRFWWRCEFGAVVVSVRVRRGYERERCQGEEGVGTGVCFAMQQH